MALNFFLTFHFLVSNPFSFSEAFIPKVHFVNRYGAPNSALLDFSLPRIPLALKVSRLLHFRFFLMLLMLEDANTFFFNHHQGP